MKAYIKHLSSIFFKSLFCIYNNVKFSLSLNILTELEFLKISKMELYTLCSYLY